MYSAAASLANEPLVHFPVEASPTHPWENFPISQVAHHGQSCCDIAREWIVAMDFAQLNGASLTSGPRWLREKYEWGPSPWPIKWCELVSRKVIDCGAHSALAHEAFKARGLTAFRAQFVQRYSADALEQWRRKWTDDSVSDHWLGSNVIYHEGNAVLVGEQLKLWDSSAGWWIETQQNGGYGSLKALRLLSDAGSQRDGGPVAVHWGEHTIRPNQWYDLESS
jgi:hypothetical protein